MTTDQLQPFDFAPGVSLRSFVMEGQPYFLAKDVCEALDLDTQNVRRGLDADEVASFKPPQMSGLPGRDPLWVTESGMYSLIMRSNKDGAKKFQRWVTSVVLPSLRTGGVYVVGQEKVDLASMTYEQSIVHIAGLQAQVAEAEASRWVKSREEKLARSDGFRLLRGKVRQ